MSAGLTSYGVSERLDSEKLLESQIFRGPLVSNVNFDISFLDEDLNQNS